MCRPPFRQESTITLSILTVCLLQSCVRQPAIAAEDLRELTELFDQDQAVRSEENRKNRIGVSIHDERARRVAVLKLLSEGRLKTANDHLHAMIILHHTTQWKDSDGKITSFSAENHILAFHLARRAHELGHPNGARFMVATYNYLVRACGLDFDQYGFDFTDDGVVAYDPDIKQQARQQMCGLDPVPYFHAINKDKPTN